MSAVNPGIVLTSITGFGQEGPYRDYKDPDIVVRALGGHGLYRRLRRPPAPHRQLRAHPQPRRDERRRRHDDCPDRTAPTPAKASTSTPSPSRRWTSSARRKWKALTLSSAKFLTRHGRARASVTLKDGSTFYNTLLWPCKDGYIALNLLLNPTAAKNNQSMMEYLKKDGIDIGFLEGWDWEKKSWEDMTREQADKLMDSLGKFFMNHTKDELLKLAMENRFQLGPCNNAEDVLKHPQLEARKFWKEIDHPELGKLKFPGGAVMTTQGYVGPRASAPAHRRAQRRNPEKARCRFTEAKTRRKTDR